MKKIFVLLAILSNATLAHAFVTKIECKNDAGSFSVSCNSFPNRPFILKTSRGTIDSESIRSQADIIDQGCEAFVDDSKLMKSYLSGGDIKAEVGTAYVDGYILSAPPYSSSVELRGQHLHTRGEKNILVTGTLEESGKEPVVISVIFNESRDCVFKTN